MDGRRGEGKGRPFVCVFSVGRADGGAGRAISSHGAAERWLLVWDGQEPPVPHLQPVSSEKLFRRMYVRCIRITALYIVRATRQTAAPSSGSIILLSSSPRCHHRPRFFQSHGSRCWGHLTWLWNRGTNNEDGVSELACQPSRRVLRLTRVIYSASAEPYGPYKATPAGCAYMQSASAHA